tara:strand:- start:48 stop:278 length:231 start_codon:yes stop_codon:yes gene_type:complete
MSDNPKHLGIPAYSPIRSRARKFRSSKSQKRILNNLSKDELMGHSLAGGKHQPIYTKTPFKQRRDKHGNVKIIRVR